MNRSTLKGKRGRNSGHKVKLNSHLKRRLKRTKRDTNYHNMSSDDNDTEVDDSTSVLATVPLQTRSASMTTTTDPESDDSDIEIVAYIPAPTAQTTGAATAGPSKASLPPPVLSLPPVVSSPMSSPSSPPTSLTTVDIAIQSLAVAHTVPNEGVSDTTSPTVTPVPSDTEMDPDIDDSGDLLYASDDDLTAGGQHSDTLLTEEELWTEEDFNRFDSYVDYVYNLIGGPDDTHDLDVAPNDQTLANVKSLITDPTQQKVSEESLGVTLNTETKGTASVEPVVANKQAPQVIATNSAANVDWDQSSDSTTPTGAVTSNIVTNHKNSDTNTVKEVDINPPLVRDQPVLNPLSLYECDYKDCFAMFATEDRLQRHKNSIHQKPEQLSSAQEIPGVSNDSAVSQQQSSLYSDNSVVNPSNRDVSANGLGLNDIPVPTPATAENSRRLWDSLLGVVNEKTSLVLNFAHLNTSETIPAFDTIAGDKSGQSCGGDRRLKQRKKSRHDLPQAYLYRCDREQCDRRYAKESQLAAHIRDKHSSRDRPFRCRYGQCERRFESQRLRVEHRLRAHLRYRCDNKRCNLAYDTADGLRYHRRRCRYRPDSRRSPSTSSHRSADEIYRCVVCDTKYDNRTQLFDHTVRVHKPLGHSVTSDSSPMAVREKTGSRVANAAPKSNEPNKDSASIDTDNEKPMAEKTLDTIINNVSVLMAQTLPEPLPSEPLPVLSSTGTGPPAPGLPSSQLNTCGQTFLFPSNLANHKRAGHPPREYGFVCHLCGHVFASQQLLKMHVRDIHVLFNSNTDKSIQKSSCAPTAPPVADNAIASSVTPEPIELIELSDSEGSASSHRASDRPSGDKCHSSPSNSADVNSGVGDINATTTAASNNPQSADPRLSSKRHLSPKRVHSESNLKQRKFTAHRLRPDTQSLVSTSAAANTKASVPTPTATSPVAAKPVHDCDKCAQSFYSESYLKQHKLSVHNDLPLTYRCRYERCANAYATKALLNLHLRQFASHRIVSRTLVSQRSMASTSRGGGQRALLPTAESAGQLVCDNCSRFVVMEAFTRQTCPPRPEHIDMRDVNGLHFDRPYSERSHVNYRCGVCHRV